MSDSLRPHRLQYARLPWPSPTPGAYWNSCPLSLWYQSNHLILCHPLLLLPSIFSSIRVFSNESVLHIRWPMYWSFSFNISPSNEYSGLISFKMEWLDLLAIQGTLKSLLNSIVQKHQFTSSGTPIIWMLMCLIFSQRSLRLSSVFSFFLLYSALQKLFSPFYLPTHWLLLLLQIFCYWLLL